MYVCISAHSRVTGSQCIDHMVSVSHHSLLVLLHCRAESLARVWGTVLSVLSVGRLSVGGVSRCARAVVLRGCGIFRSYRFIFGAGFEVRPDRVLVVWVCVGLSFGFCIGRALVFVFFLEGPLFPVALVGCWFLLVVGVGGLVVCAVGSHLMHFHESVGLSMWFWNCVGVRFVHFVCVHFLHSEHSIDCWFFLHCFSHFVHGYLFVFVIGLGSKFSIFSSIACSLLAVCLVVWVVELTANMSSFVTLVVFSVCSVVHSLSMCSWVSAVFLQNLQLLSE